MITVIRLRVNSRQLKKIDELFKKINDQKLVKFYSFDGSCSNWSSTRQDAILYAIYNVVVPPEQS